MVFRRIKRFRTRRFNRRPRFNRRRLALKRSIREHGRVVTMRRLGSAQDRTIGTGGAGTYYSGTQFTLADLTGYSELTGVFGSYRIKKIIVHWTPRYGSSSGTVALGDGNALFAFDANDAATPASVATLQEYRNAKQWNLNRVHKMVIYPRPVSALYQNLSTPYADTAQQGVWISTSYTGVPHYGLKMAFEGFPTSSTIGKLWFTYIVQFRDYV